jgi:hypothetical protein
MSRIPGLVWNAGTVCQAIYMAGSSTAALRTSGGLVDRCASSSRRVASSLALPSAVHLPAAVGFASHQSPALPSTVVE